MKKLSVIFGLLLATTLYANPVYNLALAWNASPGAVSYNLYETAVSNNLVGNTTNLTFAVLGVDFATAHTYVVTAVGTSGLESAPSTPVIVSVPAAPTGLQVISAH